MPTNNYVQVKQRQEETDHTTTIIKIHSKS
jgi:hypothetical protein